MITGYKWTRPDGTSWHDVTFGGYAAGATLTVLDAPNDGRPCGRGLHFSPRPEQAIGYGKFPGTLWRVESSGPVLGQDESKYRVASLRVIEAIAKPAWVLAAERVVAEIGGVPWLAPQGPPDPSWRHYETYAAARDAARGAAWDAARDAAWAAAGAAAGAAARAAAWDAAWAAARDAARAAARAAAWDAAWAAARAAAGAAAGAAARDAAWDAELRADIAVASDLDYLHKAKHEAHVEARWDVWRRGYGLVCDVHGVLYTYARI